MFLRTLSHCAAVIVLTAILGSYTESARGEPAAPKKIAAVEGITEYQLENGLRLLLFPDQSKPKVTVNLTVFVGSRHEGYGETGMAHLLEHMVFKGTPTHPHVPKVLQERGAQFNGTTSLDRTNYFETLPASDDNLEFALRLEADRLVNSFIKREDLLSEMTVVRNEFERGENSPASVLSKRIMSAAFEWHNYGKSTIGNRSDIERVPIENLQAFYRKHYQPDNAMVVVAGKFDETKGLALAQKHFGVIPRPKRTLDITYTEEPEQDGERLVTLRRVGEVGAVGVVYHVPAGPHADFPALQVLGNILSTQPAGRLYKALVETKRATSAFAMARPAHDPSVFMLSAEIPRDQSIDEVRETLIATVEQIGAQGVTEEEVKRAKQQILKSRELAAADTSQLAVSLTEWAAQGDWRLYFLHRDRIEQVSPSDVQNVAGRYLQRNNRTVGVYLPTEHAERVLVPSTPDVQSLVSNYRGRDALAAGETFDFSLANLDARTRREQLPEGVQAALLVKKSRGQEVYASLALRYGNEQNLKGLTSAAGFLPPLMMHGTKHLTRQQLMDELDRLKANLSTGSGGGGRRGGRGGGGGGGGGAGSIGFSIHTQRDQLPAVLDLLRQVLREPLLPADDFDVLKRDRLSNLEEQRNDPQALASRMLTRQLSSYPPDDVRYVPSIDEEIERVRAVTIEQVRAVYHDYVGSASGELAIVGDFDPEACLPVLRTALAGWKAPQPYARIERPVTRLAAGADFKINTPDKANATYTAGLVLALRDDHPDYPALVIGNFILGGGSLSSRLGDRVRQKEGLSYGVSSSFSAAALEARANFTASAICNPQNIDKVVRVIREEIDRLLRDGVAAEELARAKSGYLQQLTVSRANDAALTGLLIGLLHEERTMAYYAALEERIQNLTTEQVVAALRRNIDPQRFVIVTAGDFEKNVAGGQR